MSNDEVMRKCLKPDPSNDQIVQAICETYKQDPSNVKIEKELESYDDRNYLVRLGESKYLCKVYNGVESRNYIRCSQDDASNICKPLSSIHLYSQIWNHLNQPKYKIKTSSPVPIPNHTATNTSPHVSIHSLPVTSSEHSPCELVLQLLEWVEGTTMATAASLPIESLLEAGTYLGRVCIALDDLSSSDETAIKTADRYHAWDGKNTLDLQNFVQCIDNLDRRALVQSVLDSFQKEFVDGEEKPDFRKGILQGDFNDANIILNDKGDVSGVIDFGDTTYSWRVLDLSIAMAYAMISSYGKANRAISAASAVLRGFNSVYPLTLGERKYLRLLISSRLSCSATLGAYSYQQNPQNEYLLLHAEPAWKTLELLWGSKNSGMADAIDNMFRIACDGCDNDCSDISFPDPSIPDALKSARLDNGAEGPPPLKKQKVTIADTNIADKPIITFVTGNKKKLEEVKRILASPKSDGDAKQDESLPFTIANKKLDLPELQGDPLEIAKEKCALAAKELGGAVITEDTSLCFIALNSMPGPYIKWFLDKCGLDGLNSMIAFSQDKSGYAQTVVGFCAGPGREVTVFDGRTMGTIVPPRGSLDFGWDPIFQPDEGNGLTYAEMSKDAKDSISHRSRAFNKLRLYLENETDAIKESISFLAN